MLCLSELNLDTGEMISTHGRWPAGPERSRKALQLGGARPGLQRWEGLGSEVGGARDGAIAVPGGMGEKKEEWAWLACPCRRRNEEVDGLSHGVVVVGGGCLIHPSYLWEEVRWRPFLFKGDPREACSSLVDCSLDFGLSPRSANMSPSNAWPHDP